MVFKLFTSFDICINVNIITNNMFHLQKIIKENRPFLIFLAIYVVLRILIFNINYTEWGDTFRMIRAADYLSDGSWPWDEKRWPFYSLLLIPGIWLNAPVFWGRVVSLLTSIGLLTIIYAFYLKYLSTRKLYATLAALFVATSSVFGYWSIRVMADPVFALLVLVFFYYFPNVYHKEFFKKDSYRKKEIWLSGLLLTITMTRLEGLFVASAVGLFLVIYQIDKSKFLFGVKNWLSNAISNYKSILIFFIPQLLIYFPWTLYAKVLYKGEVNNDYLQEVQTFVFDFERLKYFLTYTVFILVIPLTVYFVWNGVKNYLKDYKKEMYYMIPVLAFVLQEFLIGFIWTPSLPRIYMPVIPFLGMLVIYGIQSLNLNKRNYYGYLAINLIITLAFAFLQYQQRLYFLGASKLLFVFIILTNLFMVFAFVMKSKYEKILAVLLLLINLVVCSVIIYNQSNVYKSVMKGIEFVAPLEGEVAYSDETGNTEWYLRKDGYYLAQDKGISNLNYEYELLKSNGIEYLLWTDEFNRGSRFIDPKADPRFRLVYIYQQPIRDPLDIVADKLNLLEDSDYTVFTTKIYKVQ